MQEKKDKRQKMTLLLTSETITILKQYGYDKFGATNVSKAVIAMAKEYGSKNTEKNNRVSI